MSKPIYQLETGTVIDHIPAGRGILVAKLLGLNEGADVLAIGVNLDSSKLGKKDVIKIEERFLEQTEIDKICLLAPDATISIIKDHTVEEKHHAHIPQELVDLVECKNPNCITNVQDEPTRFHYDEKRFTCEYCERSYEPEDVWVKR